MRTVKLILALGLFFYLSPFSGSGKEKVEYETYVNARYQFSVEYPKGILFPQGEPDNNDGNTFVTKDKKVQMSAWGAHNALLNTWEEEFKDCLDEFKDAKITYKSFKKKSFVISGLKGEDIFYFKKILEAEDGDEVYMCFEIDYPQKDKNDWNEIVKTCAGSLKKTSGPSGWSIGKAGEGN